MQRRKRIMLLPGDGIGPEVMQQAVKLLKSLEEPFDLKFELEEALIGGASLEKYGVPLTKETLEKCKSADAVLLGPVGSPAFDKNPEHLRPEQALVDLRIGLGAFCNLRSTHLINYLPQHLPATSTIAKNVNFFVIQTLRGGYYYRESASKNSVWETHPKKSNFTRGEILRVAIKAFDLARIRKRKLTAISDLSTPTSSRFWRSIVEEVAAEYPDVTLDFLTRDDIVLSLSKNPFDFDVIFSESRYAKAVNIAAGKLAESKGTLASACLGDGVSIFQPVHRTEQVIVGKNLANPIAMMNSVTLMLQYSFNMPLAAKNVEEAISVVLARGFHTIDMPVTNGITVGTEELVQHVLEEIHHCLGAPFLTA